MRLFIFMTTAILLFSCKKKDTTPANASTSGGASTTQPSVKVNAHIITYKYYNFYIIGTDTIYSKNYSVMGRMFKTAVNVKTNLIMDEYDGTVTCNGDSLSYFDGNGYMGFASGLSYPFNWSFANSVSFGTNNVAINDSCSNLTKHQVLFIPDTISLSQDFTINLTSVNNYNSVYFVYQNATNSNIAGAKVIYSGYTNLTISASELTSYGPDSMYISLSLSTDNYKVINGKTALFENVGVYTKYIKFKP